MAMEALPIYGNVLNLGKLIVSLQGVCWTAGAFERDSFIMSFDERITSG